MANKFDRIIQESFYGPTISLLRRVMGVEVSDIVKLPRKLQRTLERETDMLFKIGSSQKEECILHIEWQASNDIDMCSRMLLYHAMIWNKYKIPVIGAVIYIGEERMKMTKEISFDNLFYRYRVIDFKELDPSMFLDSEIPEEIMLALFTGISTPEWKRDVIRSILYKLQVLLRKDQQRLNQKLMQLEVFGELRSVQQIILEEEQYMAITYNLKNDLRYRQGLEEGMQMGYKKATSERNADFVKYLIQHTEYDDARIASTLNVSLAFVNEIRKSLLG